MPLTSTEQKDLTATLNYCTLEELMELCNTHSLSRDGVKSELIARILHHATTFKQKKKMMLPEVSLAKRGRNYPLHKNTLVLKGSFNTNAATRRFMQKLVGEHFRFTPTGQEWVASQWQKGKPPTYEEFARFWQQDYKRREKNKRQSDTNWAHQGFVQSFVSKNPEADEAEVEVAWQKLRSKMVAQAHEFIAKALA